MRCLTSTEFPIGRCSIHRSSWQLWTRMAELGKLVGITVWHPRDLLRTGPAQGKLILRESAPPEAVN